jgi:hypothetical protein
MKACLVLISIALIIGCQTRSPVKETFPIAQPQISFDTSRLTIIDYEKAGYLFRDYGYKISTFTQQDVQIVDSLLIEAVANHNRRQIKEKLHHRIINLSATLAEYTDDLFGHYDDILEKHSKRIYADGKSVRMQALKVYQVLMELVNREAKDEVVVASGKIQMRPSLA